MIRVAQLRPRFVEFVPEELEDGVLYISMQFATASHRCCCGCGNEIVTPFTPTDWKMTFDGETVSLDPSIGNWSFPCRSHYWIRGNAVRWSTSWSQNEVNAGRARDRAAKERTFRTADGEAEDRPPLPRAEAPDPKPADRHVEPRSWLHRLWNWLRGE